MPVFWLGSILILGQKLISGGSGVAIRMSWYAFSKEIGCGSQYSVPESNGLTLF